IDLGQIFAAPYCTLQLAYMGAEVIKVEPPGAGEQLRRPEASPAGVSYSFLMLNPNKKSITLNLKHRRGREILFDLIAAADVLVENYSAGVMESFGLGYDELKDRFPRLIYASIKGYGSDGPWAKLGALDSTVQGASGVISVTGFEDGPGTRTPATFIDMGAGSHLVSGILAALIQRGRTGHGQKVEVAMFDLCVPAMARLIANELEGKPYRRMGNRHRNACPSNIYNTADGAVLIFCVTEDHWRVVAELMHREDLIGSPRYKDHAARFAIADEVDGLVSEWTRVHPRDHLVRVLMERGVPCAPVRSVDEVVADPETKRRRMLIPSESAGRGAIRVLGSPVRLLGAQASDPSPPPILGEHTKEVLAAIGIDAAEIERLRAAGVI
ncbi:MAG TPA: CaiB/BaiF CoA-transferase family protein, partial [Candidatus Binataceae bacterium]|nr:CaiB/BaiF CoA-transferase family protein [Candidatus Binataceae bacterium]